MAIIYTYPQLTDPDGTELVVVSETKNQNATRLMTINQIASLVPSVAGGTVTSITLDFDPVAGTDTGLRLWDGVGWVDQHTITTAGSFDVGGTLAADHGGTGQHTYVQGDILYYGVNPANLEILTVASAPIGNGDVLTIAGGLPTWATPTTGTMSSWILTGDSGSETITDGETVDIEGGTDITTAAVVANKVTVTHDANARTETTVTPAQLAHGATFDAITSVTTTATGHLTADTLTTYQLPAAGTGTVVSENGSFTPVLVNQGIDGTSILALESNLIYTQQEGSWNIVDRQVYFDFYMEFKLINHLAPACRGTLGVAALLNGSLIGLDEIDPSLHLLNTNNLNNAGVNICDVEISGEEGAYQGWLYMPQNGKLNKFWGMDPAPPSNKSVAWLAWNNSQGGTNPGGYFTQYTMPLGDTWIQFGEDVETRRWRVSGSLNPILNIDLP